MTNTFDPSRFLTLVSGKEYLEVKWRLVWLRSEHPEAIIETALVTHENAEAVFKARVSLGQEVDPVNGTIRDLGSATGWGMEDAQGFGDYLEKAETKALGRALAALGYGTQFAGGDFEAPAAQAPRQSEPAREYQPEPTRRETGGQSGMATERQMAALYAIQMKNGWDKAQMGDASYSVIGVRDTGWKTSPKITADQAHELIEALNNPAHRVNQ